MLTPEKKAKRPPRNVQWNRDMSANSITAELQAAIRRRDSKDVAMLFGLRRAPDAVLDSAIRDSEVLSFLLSSGLDPNHNLIYNRTTLLDLAVEKGLPDAVRTLLKFGADPNLANKSSGFAPLHHCTSPDIVRMLITAGADVNVEQYKTGLTPLMIACCHAPRIEVVRVLLEYGAKVDVRHSHDTRAGKMRALIYACETGSLAAVSMLVEAGADVDPLPGDCTHPVLAALAQPAMAAPLLSCLLNAGANPGLCWPAGTPQETYNRCCFDVLTAQLSTFPRSVILPLISTLAAAGTPLPALTDKTRWGLLCDVCGVERDAPVPTVRVILKQNCLLSCMKSV